MGESIFIRAAAFGGYDKNDVDKRLEQLYSTIYDLKSQLRENKLVMQKLDDGAELEKSIENALGAERATLTQVQVKNENLNEKYRAAKDRAEMAEKENEELKNELEALKKELEDSKVTIESLKANDNAAGLSFLFAEAQKSAELLKESAQKNADEIRAEIEKFADRLIAETNDKAAEILYEAQKNAADIEAEAKNKSEQMAASDNNLRAIMLNDVEKLSNEFRKIREAFMDVGKKAVDQLEKSEALLGSTKDELTNDGVPVFRAPKVIEPEYPEKPEKTAVDEPVEEAAPTGSKLDLDKLQAMAEAIGTPEKKAAMSLEELAKQAAAIGAPTEAEPAAEEEIPEPQEESVPEAEAVPDELEAPEEKEEPAIVEIPDEEIDLENANPDLLKLMEQAQAIQDNDAPKKNIDLADLMKQAEGIDG